MGLLVKRRVTLDLARRGTQATVPFSLGDRCAYEVIFTLRDGSEQVALPPGTSAAVTVRNGAGGTGCVDGCVIDHVNNNVIYTPTVDALSVEGNIECTLHLFDGDGGVIGAPTFIFAVSEGDKADTEGEVSKALVANPGWGIIADTENKAKEAAEAAALAGNFAGQAGEEVVAAGVAAGEARAEADRARTEAELSKMWANGGILVDEPPSEVNNSYYWAMVAAGERMSAETQVELAAAEVNKAKTEVQNAAAEVEKAKAEAQTAEAEAIKARMWAVGEKSTPGKTSPSDSNNAMYYSNKSRDYMNEAEKYTNMTLSLSVDREKHIYTVSLIRDGTVIGNPIEIDLPFEEVVVGGEYDDTSEELVLKLKDGGSVRIPVGDIISPDDVVRRQYSGSYDAVYTETSSGEVVLLPVKVYSGDGAANTLVKRGSLGEIRVRSNPEFDDEAVPKRRVDEVADALGKALEDLEERVTQNQPAPVKIVQNLGDSPTAVIAQKGVTDAIDGLALKGSASGKVIRVDDVAPGEYPVKVRVSGVDDPSSVNVRVTGKNLLSYPYLHTTVTRKGLTFTDNGDGSITVTGTSTEFTYFVLSEMTDFADLGDSFNASNKESNTNQVVCISKDVSYNSENGLMSLNFDAGRTVNETYYPQVEFGTMLTEYEPPKSKTYTPNADGTVDSVLSVYPTMSLATDNAYAVLDAQYNKDTKRATLAKEDVYIDDITIDGDFEVGFLRPDGKTLNTDANYRTSPYIAVHPHQTIEVRNFAALGGCSLHCYDANKNPALSFEHVYADIASMTFDLPFNAHFVRVGAKAGREERVGISYTKKKIRHDTSTIELVNGWFNDAHEKIDKLFKTATKKPILTIIDDDTATVEGVQRFRDVCMELRIRGTYACITSTLDKDSTGALKDALLEYQNEGFHICMHAHSEHGLYNDVYMDIKAGNAVDEEEVKTLERDFITCIRKLKSYGFIDTDFWITPGGSLGYVNENLIKKWGVHCMVSCGNDRLIYEDTNPKRGRYGLIRPNMGADDSKSSHTLAELKTIIDNASIDNGWVLICTHMYQTGWDTDAAITRFKELVNYARDKGFEVKTLNEAWRIREPIYQLYEMF